MTCKYPVESRSYKACALCSDKDLCGDSTVKDNKVTLLSAIDAYNETKDNLKKCITKELIEISEKISKAIENGRYEIHGDGYLQFETKQRLEGLGYKVQTGSQYNEPYWSIDWH